MRYAYIDESGTSDREPIAVVAAVMIDVDRQYRTLSDGLSDLADQCAPPDKRHGFIFHAKELYHGGKTLNRANGYPPETHGRPFLKSLAHIPADNAMPVSMGYIVKAERTGLFRPDTALERNTLYHTMSFIMAAVGVDEFMRQHFPDEMCQLVSEDHPNAKRMLREAHSFLRDPTSPDAFPADLRGVLPLRHIIDTVNFAAKTESSPLQLADACAFVIRRHLEGAPDAREYYDPLVPALLKVPWADLTPEEAALLGRPS